MAIDFEKTPEELGNQVRAILGVPQEFLTDEVIFIIWWWKCCLSALAIDSFFSFLLIMAHMVSIIGIARRNIGTITDVNVTFLKPNKAITAIM